MTTLRAYAEALLAAQTKSGKLPPADDRTQNVRYLRLIAALKKAKGFAREEAGERWLHPDDNKFSPDYGDDQMGLILDKAVGILEGNDLQSKRFLKELGIIPADLTQAWERLKAEDNDHSRGRRR